MKSWQKAKSEYLKPQKQLILSSITIIFLNSAAACANDANIKKLVAEQTAQWSAMVEKQRKDEWTLQQTQIKGSKDELKSVLPAAQANQMKQLEAKHDK